MQKTVIISIWLLSCYYVKVWKTSLIENIIYSFLPQNKKTPVFMNTNKQIQNKQILLPNFYHGVKQELTDWKATQLDIRVIQLSQEEWMVNHITLAPSFDYCSSIHR